MKYYMNEMQVKWLLVNFTNIIFHYILLIQVIYKISSDKPLPYSFPSAWIGVTCMGSYPSFAKLVLENSWLPTAVMSRVAFLQLVTRFETKFAKVFELGLIRIDTGYQETEVEGAKADWYSLRPSLWVTKIRLSLQLLPTWHSYTELLGGKALSSENK